MRGGLWLAWGHQEVRYSTALGSAYEVRACFDAAVAMNYMAAPDALVLDRLSHIVTTLIKLTR